MNCSRCTLFQAVLVFIYPLLSSARLAAAPAASETDLVVYGGTAGGVATAVQAARLGKSVVLLEPGQHIGGLTSGGLGATDIGNKGAIGGIAREFYVRVAQHYAQDTAWTHEKQDEYLKKRGAYQTHAGDPIAQASGETAMWTFEPKVAERILNTMLQETGVPVRKGERLDLKNGVEKQGATLISIRMESGRVYRAKMFVDATYEGDLMARAGVRYHVGREANSIYGESLNGVQTKRAVSHQFTKPIDPYRIPGDPQSGLLPGVHSESPGEEGAGDHRVQAYNFRLCMTDVPVNQMPIPQPQGYDPLRYELLLRYIQAGVFDVINLNTPMPNRKTDINNYGGFSSDNINMNYDYPDADYVTRDRIWKDHVAYQMGMWWFLINDSRVPANVQKRMARWGLCRDEFTDTAGWPHQLYVREARRMISDYVMTEHNCRGRVIAEDPVGMGAYNMDSHNVQRYVHDGFARNEGDIQVGVKPYPISYRSIVPKQRECENLLVPICLSASHIAYGSIRMEPVFMVLGQSAATAAAMAIEAVTPIQKIDYPKLKERLLRDRQVLSFTPPPK